MPIIRHLVEADHAAVAALWHDAWHDGHGAILPADIVAMRTPATFADRLESLAADSFVAEQDGTISGFFCLLQNEIDQLYVAANARGSGLAQRLIENAEDELAARGVVTAILQCSAGNLRAYRFYSRQGWTDTGVETLPLWMPEGTMQRFHPTHVFAKALPPRDTQPR